MKQGIVYLVLTLLLFCPGVVKSQLSDLSFSQLDSLHTKRDKKTVVFIHTDWCKFCLQMQNTTFKNESVIQLLNKSFYFGSLDAEQEKDIKFQGRVFKYKPTGINTGIHELAEQLAMINGKVNYPTLTILQGKEILFQHGGFMDARELLAVLKAFLRE